MEISNASLWFFGTIRKFQSMNTFHRNLESPHQNWFSMHALLY
ncbi:unnamed protein product [Brugia pahangi]|uniref:Uncharacterized protein n=1 Tax=Brugia pahangi TaxID=6280 RepID=A0A0N4TFQ8_BRUPA|nr:unnamed protein product [Brugia pahangi]